VSGIEAAITALRADEPVVLPFDTVYGLASEPSESAVRKLYALKGRDSQRPTALVAATLDRLLQELPELGVEARSLLPGPVTLVVPNPARRFVWLTGANPDAIGIRVPELTGPAAQILGRVGVVAATSANRPGEPDPRILDEVPGTIRSGAGAVVDGGVLPGTPSTVVDLTGPEPRVLREGALPVDEVLRRLRSAVRSTGH
jgi:L-threonylcarbamoyladenylate synthase